MKKITLYIIAILAALSCSKKSEYNQTLGLLSEYNILSAEGGSTQVAVFSNTSWTVEMDHPVSWASIDRFSGEKTGYLVFDFEINYGRARRVKLVFHAGDQTRTLNMYQNARYSDSDCKMIFVSSSSIGVPTEGKKDLQIPFSTNLVYDLDVMFMTLSYPEGEEPEEPWITLKSVEADCVTVDIAKNDTGAQRQAKMRLGHTDAGDYDSTEGDTIYSNAITFVQQ